MLEAVGCTNLLIMCQKTYHIVLFRKIFWFFYSCCITVSQKVLHFSHYRELDAPFCEGTGGCWHLKPYRWDHLDAYTSSDRNWHFVSLYRIWIRFVLQTKQRPYMVEKVICQLLYVTNYVQVHVVHVPPVAQQLTNYLIDHI